MRHVLPWTTAAAALLFAAALHRTTVAIPIAAPTIAPAVQQDGVPVQQARLVCGWWGHFECARICPAAYHRHWHHHYRYYCQPVVLGLPWI
jgi:hypothetical protein